MSYTILIAEDDQDIIEILTLYLESADYRVYAASNGTEAIKLFQQHHIDMVVLDIMMPELNGYDVTKAIREQSNVPILILSAKTQDMDKILGLNMGADDYMTKPFNPLEVIARIKSNLRRYYELGASSNQVLSTLTLGQLSLNMEKASLEKNGQPIALTATEFKIIAMLMKSPGHIFTKVQLYEQVSGQDYVSDDNTMMVHISNLRDKIEDDSRNPQYIKTVRGVGYKIEKT